MLRLPFRARPIPIPAIACSLIGVFLTLLGNNVERSRVTLNVPPYSLGLQLLFSISSPINVDLFSVENIRFNSS
jgi:hypothetical protein